MWPKRAGQSSFKKSLHLSLLLLCSGCQSPACQERTPPPVARSSTPESPLSFQSTSFAPFPPRTRADGRCSSLQTSHRSFFLLLGDKAKAHAQIVNLHFLLSQSIAGLANPTDGSYLLLLRGIANELDYSAKKEPSSDGALVLQEGSGLHEQQEEERGQGQARGQAGATRSGGDGPVRVVRFRD